MQLQQNLRDLDAISISRCLLTSIGSHIAKIRWSWDHLIFTMHTPVHGKIGGLVQDCSNSIANAMELLQSWTKLSRWSLYWNNTLPPFYGWPRRSPAIALTQWALVLGYTTRLILGLRPANEKRQLQSNVISQWLGANLISPVFIAHANACSEDDHKIRNKGLFQNHDHLFRNGIPIARLRLSFLWDRNSYMAKMASLYWNIPQQGLPLHSEL